MWCNGLPSHWGDGLLWTAFIPITVPNFSCTAATFTSRTWLWLVKLIMTVQCLSTYMYCYLLPWTTFTQKTGQDNVLPWTTCVPETWQYLSTQGTWCALLYTSMDYLHFRDLTVSVNITDMMCIAVYFHRLPSFQRPDSNSVKLIMTICQHNIHDVLCCVLPWTAFIPETWL